MSLAIDVPQSVPVTNLAEPLDPGISATDAGGVRADDHQAGIRPTSPDTREGLQQDGVDGEGDPQEHRQRPQGRAARQQGPRQAEDGQGDVEPGVAPGLRGGLRRGGNGRGSSVGHGVVHFFSFGRRYAASRRQRRREPSLKAAASANYKRTVRR